MLVTYRNTFVLDAANAGEWRRVLTLAPGNRYRESRSGRRRWFGKHIHVHGIGPKPRPWLSDDERAIVEAAKAKATA